MKKIGITGNLGCGLEKTNELLSYYDYPVFEADIAIKFMLNWREDILSQTRIQFGYDVTSCGSIDPRKFTSTVKFNRLLDIIEVDLFLLWEKFVKKHKQNNELIFFKSHILFERNWNLKLDKSIYIYKPFDKRVNELMRVLKLSWDQTNSIRDKEMSENVKTTNADYVIHNYDKLSMLTQFESIREQILCTNKLIW